MGEGERDVRLCLFVVCYVLLRCNVLCTVIYCVFLIYCYVFDCCLCFQDPLKNEMRRLEGHPALNLNLNPSPVFP